MQTSSDFPKPHAKSFCAFSVQVIIAGQLLGAGHRQKAGTITVQTEGTGHMLPKHVHLLTSSEVRQVYVSQGARKQAAPGIRLQESTAAPHQSVRVGYSPVKRQAEQRCAALLTSRESGPESNMVEVAAMMLTGKNP